MANGGKITYDIGFNVDKSGLNELQKAMTKLQQSQPQDLLSKNFSSNSKAYKQAEINLINAKKAAEQVGIALQKSYNTRLNVTNVQSFTNEITKSYGSVTNLFNALNKGGIQGQKIAAQLSRNLLTTNTSLRKTETLVDKMGTTLMNTLKWTFSSSLINRFTGAIQQAVGYVEHLDRSLNDIRIVTKKSADEMEVFGEQANKAAQALGKATTDYTEAALIYYQQGLSDEEVKARAETTLKAANVTGQATKTVSEQLTAVWNGFRVNAEQTEEYVDKLAAVAAISASNLEELSTGMSKVASAASNLGVDIDQLTAQISTIVSVTRQAPESVGTALKTIYARISDLKLGETDEDGLGLGDVSGGLQKLGINVLDTQGELRDLGTVIEEVAAKWNTWTSAQQAAIAQLMAGKRQYNNLVALFSNWDMYTNAIETSRNATGELQKQQDIYMESTEAHIQQLKTQWEDMYDSLIDPDTIKTFADGFKGILKVVTDFVDTIGGGTGAFTHLIGLFTTLFSGKLASGINEMIQRISDNKMIDNLIKARSIIAQTSTQSLYASEQIKDAYNLWGKYAKSMTDEQRMQMEQETEQIGLLAEKVDLRKAEIEEINKQIDAQQKLKAETEAEIEKQASLIKTLEENLAKNNAPKDTLGNRNTLRGGKDYSENYINPSDLVEGWKNQDKELEQVQKDLDNIIETSQNASKEIDKVLNKEPKQSLTAKGGYRYDPEEWTKWGEKAKEAIDTAEKELIDLKNAGEIDDAQYNKLSTLLSGALNKDGSVSKRNWQSTKQALEEIKTAADEASQKFETARDTLNKGFSAEEFLKGKPGIEAIEAKIEELNEAKARGEAIADQEKQALEAQLQVLKDQSKIYARQNIIQGSIQLLSTLTAVGNSLKTINNLFDELYSGKASISKVLSGIGSIATTGLMAFQNLTRTIEKFKNSSSKALSSIGELLGSKTAGITMGIAAAVGVGLSIITSYFDSVRQQAIESNQAIIDQVNENQKLIDQNKETTKSLEDLISQYESGAISAKEFNDQKLKLIQNLDDEAISAFNAAQGYKEAREELEKYKAVEAEKTIQNQQTKINSGMQNVFASMESQNDLWEQLTTNRYVDYDPTTGNLKYTATFNGIDFDAAGANDFKKALDDIGLSNWENGSATFTFTPDEKGIQELEAIAKIIDQFKNTEVAATSDTYQELALMINRYRTSDAYKDVKEAIGEIESTQIEKAAAESKIAIAETKEEVDTAFELFKQYLQDNTDLVNEDILSQWRQVLAQSGGKIQQQELAKQTALTTMVEGYYANFKGDKTTTKKYGQMNEIYDQLIEKGFSSNQISGLGQDYWKQIMMSSAENLSDPDLINKISDDITESTKIGLEQAKEKIANTLGSTSDSIGKSISDAISGNLDTTSEDFKKLLNNIDEIKQSYPELTNEVETFSNQGLVGTEHWIQAAYNLQSAIDKIEFTNLNKKVEEAGKKIHNITHGLTSEGAENPYEQLEVEVVPETEDFIEAVDELLDADYEINVEVHSDAERDFTQLVDSMKQADDLASKIGEDFIVAADDIRELNNAFPGILQGIEYLGDGTIKLNEEIVQSAMNAAIQQEALSTEELVTKLNNDKTYLQNKRNIYDTMITILQKAAEKGMVTEQTVTDFDAQMDELKALNNQTVAQAEIDNDKTVAENSAANAEISADNWTKSYEYASQAAFTFAQNAIRNAQEVAKGPDGVPQSPSGFKSNFGFTWKGSGGASSEAKAAEGIKRVTKDTSVDQINSQIASLQNASEALGKEINDIDGMIAAAGAKLNESTLKNKDVGKKKDSGSGSKSGGKGKDPEQLEYIEREEDIYRAINEELDHIESQLEDIDKINSHQWGINYKKNLEQQNTLLKQQTELLKNKNKLQTDDLSTRRKQLEDVGVQFSEDGAVMLNAEEYLNELYLKHNTLIEAYNKMSASEQEVAKADLETDKNRIDAIEKKIDEYESLYKEYEDIKSQLLEQHYAEIENEVAQFNAMVDVHLELKDAEKEWNDFWKEVVEDVEDNDFGGQIAASLKQLNVLIGVDGNAEDSMVGTLTKHLNETVDEVAKQIASAERGGVDSIFGDNSQKAKETLENYRDQLMQALRDTKAEMDSISENYIKQLQYEQELIDKQAESWDNIGKHLSHNIELIKLMDTDKAYDALEIQYKQQYRNNLNAIETQRIAVDQWQKQMDTQKALMDTYEKGTEQWKTASEAYEEAVQNYIKATENLDAAVTQALEDLKEQTENANAKVLDALDKAMSGGIGMDLVEQEWKLINDEANKYFDNVERYLNMQEYINVLNDAANAVGLSVENQQKLNKFRDEELQKLNEKERLTAYDIEESKARLEIMKAQMALEDAQRNKSKMRLRRDSQGNYNYQYTADDEAVNEGENGILTAKKSWYEIVKKRYQETSNEIINLQKQQSELATQIKDAEAAGDEVRLAKLKELYDRNQEHIRNLYEETEKNKRDLYDGTALYFQEVENANILPQSEATVRQLVDQWSGGGEESFTGAVKKAIDELDANQAAFVQKSDEIFNTAGLNYQKLKTEGIDPAKEALNLLAGSNDELKEKIDEADEKLEEQWKELDKATQAYNKLKDAALKAIKAANDALVTLSNTAITSVEKINEAINAANEASKITYNTVVPSSSGGDSGSGGGNTGGGNNTKKTGDTPSTKTGYRVTYTDSSGGHSYSQVYDNKERAKEFAVDKLIHGALHVSLLDEKTQKSVQGDFDKIKNVTYAQARYNMAKGMFSAFRSGGYTGEWGNSGKLGILHEKELVLNESDTKNMLAAIQLLRSIPYSAIAESIINSSASTARILSGVNSTFNGLSGGGVGDSNKTMVVNADFSGVRDADEIYQALIELENYGMQNSYSVAPHANSMY